MTRFVIDCETLLRIAAGEIEVAPEHKLVAPTLVRSQALSALYEASRRGEISAADGLERVTRINSLKVRFLGDKVLQRKLEHYQIREGALLPAPATADHPNPEFIPAGDVAF